MTKTTDSFNPTPFYTGIKWCLGVFMLCMLSFGITQAQNPCPVTVSLAKVHPTCNGDCDGSITANASNGSGQYTYMWSNGATTMSISSLCAGTYTVTVTDSVNNCSTTMTDSIFKGAVGAHVTKVNPGCSCTGSITVVGNGGNGGPYTYLWSTGETTNTRDSLCAGTYTVTITDDEGCTYVCITNLVSSGSFTMSADVEPDTNCVPGCSGSIMVTPDPGPVSNYMYMWSNGATTNSIMSLCAGTYTVTATDSSGCSVTQSYTVADSSNCGGGTCELTLSKVHPTCYGDCDGSVTANVSGGSGQYTYLWNTGATTMTISNQCAGMYTVTITDPVNQCSITDSTMIQKARVSGTVMITNATCGDCNGSMSVTPHGGNGWPYTFLWSTGDTTQTITDLCPGTYTITITDSEGCTWECPKVVLDDTTNCGNDCNDFTTYTQGGWGNPGAPGQYMAANFDSCFGSVVVGDACGFTITLTSVSAVQDFLPQGGTPAALTQNYTDPGSGNITVLAGQVLGVAFALGFDACDSSFSGSPNYLGEQIYIDSTSVFYGWSIQAIYDTARMVLSGCPSNYTPSEVNDAATAINENYDGGANEGWFVCPDDFTPAPAGKNTVKAEVFPNPFNKRLTINTKANDNLTIIVTDISGRVMETFSNVNGLLDINSDWDDGIYIITLINPSTGYKETIRAISTE
jgi:hypothetical protein